MHKPPKRPAHHKPSAPPKVRRRYPGEARAGEERDFSRRPPPRRREEREERDGPHGPLPQKPRRKPGHFDSPRGGGPRPGPGRAQPRHHTPPRGRGKPGAPRPAGDEPAAPRPAHPQPRRQVRFRGSDATGDSSHALFPEMRRALRAVMVDGKRLDKTIEAALRARRRLWTGAERSRFVTMLHGAVRDWRARWNAAGLADADCTKAAAITDDALRLILRAPAELPATAKPAVRASFPDWLWHRASVEIGPDWPRLVASLAAPAPLFLRPNTLRTDARKLAALLAAEGIRCVEGPGGSLRVGMDGGWQDIFATEAFGAGLFEVQDAGSQLIAPLLGAEPGWRVVDACAGAGGKTLHLAALMKNKGRIVALDIHEWKLAELRRRASRAGADTIELRHLEGPRVLKKMAGTADAVLLDVPCSGLGVLRRHPDRKWHLRADELDRLTTLQAQLLRDHAPLVKPGGALLYATCSFLPSENQQQVRAFLDAHAGWRLDSEHLLHPAATGGDAYYAARLIAPAPQAAP